MRMSKPIATLFLCATLGGCAVGALPEKMTFNSESPLNFDAALETEISVAEVSGGKKTNPLWTSEINGVAFQTALKDSLKAQGLFSDNGQFSLQATFVTIDQPFGGFDMTVTTEIQYVLTDNQTGEELVNKVITSAFTATVGDAFLGSERLQRANEGSARESIEQLLNALSDLEINGQVSLAN